MHRPESISTFRYLCHINLRFTISASAAITTTTTTTTTTATDITIISCRTICSILLTLYAFAYNFFFFFLGVSLNYLFAHTSIRCLATTCHFRHPVLFCSQCACVWVCICAVWRHDTQKFNIWYSFFSLDFRISPKIGGQIKCAVLFDNHIFFFCAVCVLLSSFLLLLSSQTFHSFILSTYVYVCLVSWKSIDSFALKKKKQHQSEEKKINNISKVMSKNIIVICCLFLHLASKYQF